MRTCLLPYFDKEQFSGDLVLNKKSFGNMEELKESVKLMLEGDLPFRIKTDISDSDYEDSINELIQTLYSKIQGLDLQFEFDSTSKRELSRYVKSIVMPKPLTKVEKLIQANIAGSDLITEDQRRNLEFRKIVRSIYGKGTSALNATRQGVFNDEMIIRSIIDTNRGTLITNIHELNEGIVSYQIQQYNMLKEYLINQGYNLSDYGIPQNLYHTDPDTKISVLTKGYYNLYTLMYNIIEKERRNGTLEQLLEDGWVKHVLNSNETTFYKAVNSYINLVYFDDVLQQFLGDYININTDYDAPITKQSDGYNNSSYIYKYSFNKGNKHLVKNWGEEYQDAINQMSKFSEILISSIPVYEYDIQKAAESESFKKLEVKDFVNTISKLLDLGSQVADSDLKDLINSFQTQPRKSILSIFKMLFGANNKNLLDNLSDLGFDQNYINYLYSIYRTCFQGKNSWDAIEQKYIRNNGIPETYPIIQTILGVMNSNVANNFLQSVYNYDQEEMQTTVKKKYNDRSTKFDILTNVNNLTVDRLDKKQLLDKYQLSQTGRNYSITMSVQGNPVKFEFLPLNNTGILDKESKSTKLEISNMPKLNEINLDSINNRSRLIGGVGLSDNEYKFMAILKFIDDMLATRFSADQEGLLRLRLMQKLYSNNFKELFASAARALVVTDIYNQMEESTKEDGTNYSKLEVLQFLNEKNPYYDKIQLFSDKNKKPYFIQRFDGYQLSTLYSGQEWLDHISQVEASISGETSKSVISNLDGDKIPNFSPQFLGARPEQQIEISKNLGNATSNLLFVQYGNAIKQKVINTDVLTKDGIRKQIKNMTSGELLYDSIVNKFFVPILTNNTVYTQPTTYSDKTKFLLYGVSLDTLGINTLVGDRFEQNIEKLLQNTIGKTYEGVWSNVKNDYKTLFQEYVTNGQLDIDSVQDWLNTHTASELQDKINEYNNKNKTNLVFYKDTHYREITLNGKKRLSINELLVEYSTNLYKDKLHARLQQEKINFLKDLLSNRVTFPVQRDPKDPEKLLQGPNADAITRFLIKLKQGEASKWVQGSNMVLAQAVDKNGKTRNILYGDIKEGETIILNPALNAYFMLDTLIGNNLRMSLTGSEINHKVKSLAGLNLDITGVNLFKPLIQTLNPKYSGNQTTFYDIQRALYNYDKLNEIKSIQKEINDPKTDKEVVIAQRTNLDKILKEITISPNTQVNPDQVEGLRKIYDAQIYLIENAAQNAQFKRNVIIPGTMRPYTPDCIDGLGRSVKIAVINDVPANVFNFDGKSDKIDAHDGSAMESPITSILENNSLQDNEVGTIKKPIHHWYDDRYGTSTLLKYAVDTITNQWMRQSEGNNLNNQTHAIRLRNLFKKMHHIRWYNDQAIARGERGIDLIDGCDFKARTDDPDFQSIDFHNDILKQGKLFYKKGIQDFQIVNFGKENGIYYTIEQKVEPTGFIQGKENAVKVYHYFDDNGNHFPSNTLLQNTNLHTIDSLYELHTAMGGIYSESINSEGLLQYSESSNEVVANFVNFVAYKKDPEQSNKVSIDQSNYYQPLKEKLIDVLANNSAVKNGAGNVNSYNSYYDDSQLSYMEIGTSQYGIQMDADHTADEGKMTEFSQVISSLDAGGRLHEYVSQIYETLGEVAIQLSKIELDAVEAFRNGEGKTKLYDIVGRTIINNLAKNREEAGLAEAIIQNIKDKFNLNTDHELDAIKIPFSDPSIYSSIVSTLASVINKKSIKRQYPGQGTVMVPGYDLSMIYDLNGKTYQFEDLIKMSVSQGYESISNDVAQYHRDIVSQLLWNEQSKQQIEYNTEKFQPTDNVLITYRAETFNINSLNLNEVEYEIVKEPWKDNPDKLKDVLKIYIKGHKELGSFDLVKDEEYGYFSVHFKTGDADTNESYGSTKEQRNILYQNLYSAIPEGALVSTHGNVSKGGVFALNKLMDEYIGDIKVDNIKEYREVKDRNGNKLTIPVFRKFGTGQFEYDDFTIKKKHISLKSIEDYYLFKDNINEYINSKIEPSFNVTNLQFQKDITVPRNLAPVRISWNYSTINPITNQEEVHTMNIFDHWRIKELFLAIDEISNRKGISKSEKKRLIQEAREQFNPQQAFDELEKKLYIDKNGNEYSITNLSNKPAELIMSNIYKTKFGIKDGDSLASIIDQGPSYFKYTANLIPSTSYDMAFTKQDGRHLYLTFKPIWQNNSDTFDSHHKEWNSIMRQEFHYPEGTPEKDRIIVNRVYATTQDNLTLFEVGREILRTDVLWDPNKRKFTDNDGNVLKNQKSYRRYGDNKVLEYIEFLSRYNVEEEINGKTNKYVSYNINRSALSRVMHKPVYSDEDLTRKDKEGNTYKITQDQKFDEEVNDFISRKLLAKIYESSDFNGVQVNSTVTPESHTVISNCLYRFGNSLSYDPELSSYLSVDLLSKVKNPKVSQDGLITYEKLNSITNRYRMAVARKQYASFLKSQSFTASRIPAQTLQSFMQMQCVGFTGVSTNQCFVSHWQTWLQGSDY